MQLTSPMSRRVALAAGVAAAVPFVLTAAARGDDHGMAGDYAKKTFTLGMLSKETSMMAEKMDVARPVKTFAELEIAEVETVTKALLANGATKPEMPADLKQKLEMMKGLQGDAFQEMYLAEQIATHEQLLPVQEQKAGGDITDPTVVLASLAVDSIKSHIEMLKMIQSMA